MLSRLIIPSRSNLTRFVQRVSLAHRAFLSTTARPSITDVITKDHRELETYYKEVVNSTDLDHQERYGNQFIWELARHSVGEELVVYPAMEKYLGAAGKETAEKDRKEHHEVSDSGSFQDGIQANYLIHRSRNSSKSSRC